MFPDSLRSVYASFFGRDLAHLSLGLAVIFVTSCALGYSPALRPLDGAEFVLVLLVAYLVGVCTFHAGITLGVVRVHPPRGWASRHVTKRLLDWLFGDYMALEADRVIVLTAREHANSIRHLERVVYMKELLGSMGIACLLLAIFVLFSDHWYLTMLDSFMRRTSGGILMAVSLSCLLHNYAKAEIQHNVEKALKSLRDTRAGFE